MCGRTPFSLSSFVAPGTNGQPMAAVEGGFDASVRNIYDLTIKQHSLALNYGAIILGVVEKLVIPAVTDGKATNLKDLVFWMLGGKYPEEHPQYPGQECVDAGTGTVMQNCCEALSWKVSQDNATWRDVTKSICEAGVPVLVDTLTSYLVGLQVDSGSTLVVGTSDAFEELPAADRKACKMAFKIYNGRMTLWTMGAEAQDKRCNLRAGLKIADWPIDFAEATFYTEERLGDAE